MRRLVTALLAALLLLSVAPTAFGAEAEEIERVYGTTEAYLTGLGTPTAGGLGGEWMVLGLARSGKAIDEAYYESAAAYIQAHMDDNGRLHPSKSTVNCRFVVALTAIGRDVTDVGGQNLLAGLDDMAYIQKAGISGLVWALLAVDCGNYATPGSVTRQALVEKILAMQVSGGGWAVTGSDADPDMTAMAIQALAPYVTENAVKEAVETALTVLSEMQDETGNFPTRYGTSSESVSQVVVALSTLGMDANADARFVKNGVSAMDALLAYHVEGGGFKHIADGKRDGMATEQGYYALTAYARMKKGQNPLYQMSDVAASPAATATGGADRLWLYATVGVGAALTAVCLLLRKKLGKRRCGNAIMAVLLLEIVALGLGFAAELGAFEEKVALGSQYRIQEIPGNRLVSDEQTQNLCTITIDCRTILEHLSLLDEEKAPYVPAGGMILDTVTVEFTPGESVLDVLKRVCEASHILLEYSWAPVYDAYYLEGINHLYEFDCGSESGWMYQVNGSFPNYGCSDYEVKPGDSIVWRYTCIGMGADLGAEVN